MLEVSRLEVSVGSSARRCSCERAVAAQLLLVGMARMAVRAPNTKTVKFVAFWYGFTPLTWVIALFFGYLPLLLFSFFASCSCALAAHGREPCVLPQFHGVHWA